MCVCVCVCVENVALGKTIYESSGGDADSSNSTVADTVFDFCNDTNLNTSSPDTSWWTIDLFSNYRIRFIEITPQPGSLCPENSLCGRSAPIENHYTIVTAAILEVYFVAAV